MKRIYIQINSIQHTLFYMKLVAHFNRKSQAKMRESPQFTQRLMLCAAIAIAKSLPHKVSANLLPVSVSHVLGERAFVKLSMLIKALV